MREQCGLALRDQPPVLRGVEDFLQSRDGSYNRVVLSIRRRIRSRTEHHNGSFRLISGHRDNTLVFQQYLRHVVASPFNRDERVTRGASLPAIFNS